MLLVVGSTEEKPPAGAGVVAFYLPSVRLCAGGRCAVDTHRLRVSFWPATRTNKKAPAEAGANVPIETKSLKSLDYTILNLSDYQRQSLPWF